MKQIKPVVSHYVKVQVDGGTSRVQWKKSLLCEASRNGFHLHKNGKPKFRLVYDYGVSHEVES